MPNLVQDEKFAHAMRGWSKRVHNCTSPAAQEAGIACSDCHEKCLMPSEKKVDGWTLNLALALPLALTLVLALTLTLRRRTAGQTSRSLGWSTPPSALHAAPSSGVVVSAFLVPSW